MQNVSKKSSKGLLGLFLLWPFVSFLMALREFSRKESQVVIYFFLLLYGFTFVISGEAVDSFRHAQALKDATFMTFSDFLQSMRSLYTDKNSTDLVHPLAIFLISRFTDNQSYLFLAFSAIFGFFHLKGVSLVCERYQQNTNINSLVYLLFFVSVIPIFDINGFRFGTAAWVFFLGAYHVLACGHKRYLLLVFSSALFHFSFLGASFVFAIYFFLGNKNWLYFPLLIASFIIPDLLITYSEKIGELLGGSLQYRITTYTSEAYRGSIQAQLEETRWFVIFPGKIALYYLLFATMILRYRFNVLMKVKALKNVYSFSLLFLTYVNFGQNVPTFGDRFQKVYLLFATLFIILIFSKVESKKWNWITIVGVVPMLLFVALCLRTAFMSLSPWLFAPMPFPLIGGDQTLNQIYEFFFK